MEENLTTLQAALARTEADAARLEDELTALAVERSKGSTYVDATMDELDRKLVLVRRTLEGLYARIDRLPRTDAA